MLNIKYKLFVFKKAFQGFTFLKCRWLCKYFQMNISTRFQTNMTSTWSVQSIDVEVSSVIYVRMCCSKYVFYKKQKKKQYWVKKNFPEIGLSKIDLEIL